MNTQAQEKPAVILVGNPNVGKSVVFSYLTGRYAVVSNYPGTTVEVSRGKLIHGGGTPVIDTPGVNSLHPQSLDERVTRDILFSSPGGTVLQVADAKNLRRALTVTTQLAELGLPVVLDLNLMDEARRRGVKVSGTALSEKLGVPVVETVAVERQGMRQLVKALDAPPAIPKIHVRYPDTIEDAIAGISSVLPDLPVDKRGAALMFLADPFEASEALLLRIGPDRAAAARRIVVDLQATFSHPLSYIIGVSRSRVVDEYLDTVYLKDAASGRHLAGRTRRRGLVIAGGTALIAAVLYAGFGADSLGRWGLHPLLLHFAGFFALLVALRGPTLASVTTHRILGVLFLLEVLYLMYLFVGVFGAGTLVDAMQKRLFDGVIVPPLARLLGGEAVPPWVRDLFVGQYGLVSMGLSYSIAIVMPIVTTFFVAFGVLEDSGYLPRLSVMADRLMRRMGLNGKAVLPMVLGLGCDTMATLTTRILESRKERTIATILLALGVPCSAQLGVIMAMAAGSSVACVLTVFGVVAAQLFIVGSLSNRLIKGRRADFIMEIPPLRVPILGNIWLKTFHRVVWFLREAVPLFLIGTLILFVLDRFGTLTLMERGARPVVEGLLGLPIESTVAFIVGFFRRDYGAAGLYDLFAQGKLTTNQVAVSMVVITLFVPCIAQFFVMIKERGFRTAALIVAFILPFAILVGTLLNGFLRLTGIEL